jgi:hypothetical protein
MRKITFYLNMIKMKYALLIVFEYNPPERKYNFYPSKLPAMNEDLKKAWEMANVKFQIPRENITIVTDIRPVGSSINPWEPLHCRECSPIICHLQYPYVHSVISEIENFVENTVRGFSEVVNKGEVDDEVLVYISCHGAKLPEVEADCCLTLVTEDFKVCYLHNVDIFNLLFGRVQLRDCDMNLKVSRKVISDRDGRAKVVYVDESITVPSAACDLPSLSETQSLSSPLNVSSGDGLPHTVRMMILIDACNSGRVTNFPFRYNHETTEMIRLRDEDQEIGPYCICFSSSDEGKESIGTRSGSIFTNHFFKVLEGLSRPVSVPEFHRMMMSDMSKAVQNSRPMITSTHEHLHENIPLIGCEVSENFGDYKCKT